MRRNQRWSRAFTGQNHREWILFPPDRKENFEQETHTTVLPKKDRVVIIGERKADVDSAVQKLEERAGEATVVAECKYKVRWVLGHDRRRAVESERKHNVRLVHWPHEQDATLTWLKVIGSNAKIKEAFAAMDFKKIVVVEKEGKAEFGMFMTNHGDFRQGKYEDATNTVIIFEKDLQANANGRTRYIIAGRREGVQAATKTLGKVEAQIIGFPAEISFRVGRYIIGPRNEVHRRRLAIEKLFNVTLHLEREAKDPRENSLMIIAGLPANVEKALAHLTASGPLVEMCYELDAELWPKLVPNDGYEMVNHVGHETQTQINVGLPKTRVCRCLKESRDQFELSISGPQTLVREARDRIKTQLAEEVGGPSALEKMFRERGSFVADPSPNSAAAKNAHPAAFIYPLVYWPCGTQIGPQDISVRDRKLCQAGGMRMCGPNCYAPTRAAYTRGGCSRAGGSRAPTAKQCKKPTESRAHATASNATATVSSVHATAPPMNATTSYATAATAANADYGATYAQTAAPTRKTATMSYAQAAASKKKPTLSYAQVAASNHMPTTSATSMSAHRK